MLDHGLSPADQFARVLGGGFDEEDLERPLQGVVGIIGADRVAPGGAAQRRLVLRIGLDRGTLS